MSREANSRLESLVPCPTPCLRQSRPWNWGTLFNVQCPCLPSPGRLLARRPPRARKCDDLYVNACLLNSLGRNIMGACSVTYHGRPRPSDHGSPACKVSTRNEETLTEETMHGSDQLRWQLSSLATSFAVPYWHWHRGLIAAGCPLFFLLVSDFGRDLLTYQLRRLPD